MKHLFAIGASSLLLAACTPTSADPAPAATSSTVSDTDGVQRRFADDIWPAVAGYRAPGQGSPEYQRWTKVIDAKTPEDYGALRASSQNLGKVMNGDLVVSFPSDELRLADTALTALDPSSATVVACYTYHSESESDPNQITPAASQATFGLKKTDKWFLHSITNDHVVPGCSSSKA